MKNLIVIVICSLWGCGLFQKTSKSSYQNTHKSNNQLEASQLVLKAADKETQIFTYWNDSSVYQYQFVKEQAADMKAERLATKENTSVAVKQTKKQVETISSLGIVVLLCMMVVVFLLYKRFLA